MKKRIFIAVILYLIGLINIIDWYVFWYQNETLALKDFKLLKVKYIERFPDIIKPFYSINPQPAAVIFFITLIFSGIIFVCEKKTIYLILGVTSFLFALQNLFSIM